MFHKNYGPDFNLIEKIYFVIDQNNSLIKTIEYFVYKYLNVIWNHT